MKILINSLEVVQNMAKDPVCGMFIDETKSRLKSEYMGKTFYFCSPACKSKFESDPRKFTN